MTLRHCEAHDCCNFFVSRRHRIYCTKDCYNRARNLKLYPPRTARCMVCHRQDTVANVKRSRYLCSNDCRRVHAALRYSRIKGQPLAIRAMLSYLKHCQACGERFDSSDRMKRACIDHDHETGYFRGIICGNCNITEGRMNATSFRKLADYLDRTTPSNEMSGYIQTATE